MEFNYRAVDGRANSSDQPPLSRYNYFTEQPIIRGGYSTVGMRRDSDYFQNSVHEAIHRELEKEKRTREGFVEENSGRRAVEDELRRDLRMENELALRGRGVDEVGRFQAGMGMRVEDRRMTNNEEMSMEERIAKIVEERIVSSLEGRIVMALERSGIVERIARKVEERIARTVDERIAISLEGRIARTVDERAAISLERFGTEARRGIGEQPLVPFRPGRVEGRIARTVDERTAISLERFGTEARRGIGEQPLVPFRPGRVEYMVKEVEQPSGHIMKEAKSDANHCNANTPPKQGVARKAASTDVANNTVKEDWSCANLCDTNAPPKQGVRMAGAASTDVAKNIVKEDWSCANRCDTNAPPKQGVRMAGGASTDAPRNIVKEDWSCSLCKVKTTSKRTLDDHVRGKKHKFNEASLNLGSKRKNSDSVLPPNKKAH